MPWQGHRTSYHPVFDLGHQRSFQFLLVVAALLRIVAHVRDDFVLTVLEPFLIVGEVTPAVAVADRAQTALADAVHMVVVDSVVLRFGRIFGEISYQRLRRLRRNCAP